MNVSNASAYCGVDRAVDLFTLSRAGDRTRTGDVQLGKLAFYQLNYAREDEWVIW